MGVIFWILFLTSRKVSEPKEKIYDFRKGFH